MASSITAHLKSSWPHATQISLCSGERTNWGRTEFTTYTDKSERIHILVGVHGGISPAVLAHEANHAATRIMRHPDWRNFMPNWGCGYQQEESSSFIIERIVWKGLALASENNIKINNSKRKVPTEFS